MIAMLGLTMAGAGVMKSESARKKQDELAKQDAIAQANLVAILAEQKDSAEDNWAENQAMRAEAKQQVYTKVTQSQANKDFWASYTAWKIKVAEAEEKRRQAELEARIKAYYEALRLKPASPQPAQPAPVLGLLTGLLTGAKLLGQGIKAVNQILKNLSNVPHPIPTGGSNGDRLNISPVWGNSIGFIKYFTIAKPKHTNNYTRI